jgi:hypothetical protein
MADRDDLRLNELQRYQKTSNRLALEVHSHCEVPAGCGGVVLRWRRPDAEIGIAFTSYLSAPSEGFFLDGKPLPEQRVSVPPGEHVLSFVVDKPGDKGFLLLRARLEPSIASARQHEAMSQADGRWRVATQQPLEGWQLPRFDDSAFEPLVEKEVPKPKGNQSWVWEVLKRDTKGLGLPPSARSTWGLRRARAWVRWVFRVSLEGFS